MARIRILVEVPGARSVVRSAALTLAPQDVPQLPPGFEIDPEFPPVPITSSAARRTLEMRKTPTLSLQSVGEQAGADYVVRGSIDERDLKRAQEATRLPDGRYRIFSDPKIRLFPTCLHSKPVGKARDVQHLLKTSALAKHGMDGKGVALAIVDNGINVDHLISKRLQPILDTKNSWSPTPALRPGKAPLGHSLLDGHGTMCAYDALLAAPRATLLDCAILYDVAPQGSFMEGYVSNAVLAYSKLVQLMELPPSARKFHSLVVSNSWGMASELDDFKKGEPGRYCDDPTHTFNKTIRGLADLGADILFAAGNCGPTCPDMYCDQPPPPIFFGNAHDDVLCVAGVDVQGRVVGYSSHGPGVLNQRKPDLAAYTHFLGSEALGSGIPDVGTSAACPVLAGAVAALRSAYPFDSTQPKRSPASLRNFLTNPISGPATWHQDKGYGIIDTKKFSRAGTVM